MSNSLDSFEPKEDRNEINFDKSSPPSSNSSIGYSEPVSNQNLDHVQENQELHQGSTANNTSTNFLDGDEEEQEVQQRKTELGESEVADDDEGFRTPTSLDQRIPVIPVLKCPPAPRKPRPPSPPPSSRKRKLSRIRRNVVKLDFSSEIESFFPRIVREDLGKKMKKSKKNDDEDDANK